MNKKWNKMLLCGLLVCCLISTAVFAESAVTETSITPRYTYIASIGTNIGISLSGKATCYTGVTLYEETHSCTLEMILQKDDGTGWDDVKKWTASDGWDLDLEEIWYVTSGYEYRTKNTIRVYNASGRLIETVTTYSEIFEY